MFPDEETAEEAVGSLPTTTFQSRTSHFFTSPFWTYGSLRAKDSTLVFSSTWKTIKALAGSARAPAKTISSRSRASFARRRCSCRNGTGRVAKSSAPSQEQEEG